MDCHRPLAFAMIVWVGCGDYHNEIATASTKPRNDDSCFCHCEQSEAIYKPLIINAKTENKKIRHSQISKT